MGVSNKVEGWMHQAFVIKLEYVFFKQHQIGVRTHVCFSPGHRAQGPGPIFFCFPLQTESIQAKAGPDLSETVLWPLSLKKGHKHGPGPSARKAPAELHFAVPKAPGHEDALPRGHWKLYQPGSVMTGRKCRLQPAAASFR